MNEHREAASRKRVEVPGEEESPSILGDERIQSVIERFDVGSEDYGIIEELASFTKNEIIEVLHNTFNMYKERAASQLKSEIRSDRQQLEGEKDDRFRKRLERQIDLKEKALVFTEKYDHWVAYALVRALEKLGETD